MATYKFETITAAEAISLQASDILEFTGAPSTKAVVHYLGDHMAVAYGARTVDFANTLIQVSQAGNLQFADGSRLFIGDGANDKPGEAFYGTRQPATFFGGQGADTIIGGQGENFIHGNQGDDLLTGSGGPRNQIMGGQGADVLHIPFSGGAVLGSYLHGNIGSDTITSSTGADTLLGGQDNDLIKAGGGGDYVSGDLGDDTIQAETSNDTIYGGDGDDNIEDRGGANFIDGGAGRDRIFIDNSPPVALGLGVILGGSGSDQIVSFRNGDESISGGDGYDNIAVAGLDRHDISAGDGDDIVQVAVGVTVAYGGAGYDFMVQTVANSGLHTFYGEGGDDQLLVSGNCTAYGGDGADILVVEASQGNVLNGGAGADRFHFSSHDAIVGTQIQAVIQDFTAEDRIVLKDLLPNFTYAETTAADFAEAVAKMAELAQTGVKIAAFQIGADVILLGEFHASDGLDVAVRLADVTLDGITQSQFIF